jgi:hypothetical protein
MRRVTWQTLASAEEAAAADGPFSSVKPASAGTTDSSPLPSYRVTADPPDLTPVRPYLSNSDESLPEESASASHTGPGAGAPEGQRVSFDLNCGPGAGAHERQPVSFEHKVPSAGPPTIKLPDGGGTLASSSNESSSSGSIPSSKSAVTAGSTTEWTIKSHRRRTTHSSRKIVPGGNTATRHAAGVSGGAAAAAADSSWMDKHVGYHLLQNLGLAGGFAARLALLGATLLHGVILSVSHHDWYIVQTQGSSNGRLHSAMHNSRTRTQQCRIAAQERMVMLSLQYVQVTQNVRSHSVVMCPCTATCSAQLLMGPLGEADGVRGPLRGGISGKAVEIPHWLASHPDGIAACHTCNGAWRAGALHKTRCLWLSSISSMHSKALLLMLPVAFKADGLGCS